MAQPARELPLTPEEYLAFEAEAEERHEYEGGRLWAMSGATVRHNEVVQNVAEVLRPAARARGCRLYTETVKLRTPDERFSYPDVMVVCDPSDDDPVSRARPCFLLEVLSPSTEHRDRVVKLRAYRTLPGLEQYAIADPERREVEVFERRGEFWTHAVLDGEAALEVRCLGVAVGLETLFAGFEPA